MKRNQNKILAGIFLGLTALTAQAADFSWNNAISYLSFEDAANWSPNGNPTSTDRIVTPTLYGAPALAGTSTVGGITVNLNAAWTLTASAVDARLNVAGDLIRTGGNTLNFRDSAASDGYSGAGVGKLDLEIGGNFSGAGSATNFGTSAAAIRSVKVVGTTTSSTTLGVNASESAEFLGGITLNNSGILYVHRYFSGTGGLSTSKLNSASTTTAVRGSDFAGSLAILTINGGAGDAGVFAGFLHDYGGSANTSNLSLIKTGAGSQEFLNGTSNFSGGTTINAGTLIVSNSTGSGLGKGNVAVESGGTLAGTGIIAPDADNQITVAGTLSPGKNGTGTLSFNLSGNSSLTFETGAELEFTLGTSSDLIRFASVGDYLEGSGTATLALTLGGGFDYNNAYTIFENVSTTGFTLAGITGYDTAGYTANWAKVGDAYQVSFHAVPEPGAVALFLAGVSVVALLRRKGGPAVRNSQE